MSLNVDCSVADKKETIIEMLKPRLLQCGDLHPQFAKWADELMHAVVLAHRVLWNYAPTTLNESDMHNDAFNSDTWTATQQV
jgi:hypothetical protein